MSATAEFLLARYAEEEAVARYAAPLDADCIADDGLGRPRELCSAGTYDPAGVLADIGAERQIVAMAPVDGGVLDDAVDGVRNYGWPPLRHLAAVYADRPDHRQEWTP